MIFCHKCGKKANDTDVFCMSCGARLIKESDNQENAFSQPQAYAQTVCQPQSIDKESTGLNIISFFFPLIGAILYLLLKDERPKRANGCGKWALISVITSVGIFMAFWFMVIVINLS